MGEGPALRLKYEGVMGEAPALKFKFEYSKGCVEDSMIVEMPGMAWHGDSAVERILFLRYTIIPRDEMPLNYI